jgi:hypothetical protein
MAIGSLDAYVTAIKHPAKKAYALQYLHFLRSGGAEPTRPPGLSVMGAQAVRLQLQDK